MLSAMGSAVSRWPSPRAAAFIGPAVAALLAAGAIGTTILLQIRAERDQEARVHIVQVGGDLTRLQTLPWDADIPRRGDAVQRELARTERRIEAAVSRLDAGAPLHRNFAALAALYAVVRAGGSQSPAARTAADRAEVTLAAATKTLAAAAAGRERQAERAKLLATAGSALAILVLFCAFVVYHRISRRSAARRRQAHCELGIAHAKLERAQEDRMRLLARTVEGAEDERRRIAADLHDGPIQRLTATAFALDLLGNRIARGERDVDGIVQQVRDQLAGEMQSLRRLMSELRPPVLDEGGVAAAIRHAADEILSPSTVCTVHDHTAAARLTPQLETIVYRVAREALMNVQKHARATQVAVSIERSGGRLRMTVADDGIGFDQNEVAARPAGATFGLMSIRERLESVGGELGLTAAPGHGARLEATLPWRLRNLPEARAVA
jgi:signal transduction histidine kinase